MKRFEKAYISIQCQFENHVFLLHYAIGDRKLLRKESRAKDERRKTKDESQKPKAKSQKPKDKDK